LEALVERWDKCMLVEDVSRNKCLLQVRISHFLRFVPICYLFTDCVLLSSDTTKHSFRYWSIYLSTTLFFSAMDHEMSDRYLNRWFPMLSLRISQLLLWILKLFWYVMLRSLIEVLGRFGEMYCPRNHLWIMSLVLLVARILVWLNFRPSNGKYVFLGTSVNLYTASHPTTWYSFFYSDRRTDRATDIWGS
jgi:hypothetical protein